MNVLLVEDDRNLGSCLRRRIEGGGDVLDWTAEGDRAFECASSSPYDAVIVDLGLSDMRGIELCARLRQTSEALPILALTAGDRIADRLEGFAAGADDVLAKPFDIDELMARLAAIQRRKAPEPVDPPARRSRMIVVDRVGRAGSRESRVVELSDREFRFFDALLRHKALGVSLTAAFRAPAFRDTCDVDVPGQRTGASGLRTGFRRRLEIARDMSRKLVRSGARLARLREQPARQNGEAWPPS